MIKNGCRVPSKRQTFSASDIVLIVEFYIVFNDGCRSVCQNAAGSDIRQTIYNENLSSLDLSDVTVIVNGTAKVAPRIAFVSLVYVSDIGKGMKGILRDLD